MVLRQVCGILRGDHGTSQQNRYLALQPLQFMLKADELPAVVGPDHVSILVFERIDERDARELVMRLFDDVIANLEFGFEIGLGTLKNPSSTQLD